MQERTQCGGGDEWRQLEVWLVRISLPLPLSLLLSLPLSLFLSAASFCLFVLAQCVKVNLVKSLLFIISLPSSSASLALFELATCLPHPPTHLPHFAVWQRARKRVRKYYSILSGAGQNMYENSAQWAKLGSE